MPTVLRLYWWRFNGSGFALGTLVGLIAASPAAGLILKCRMQQILTWSGRAPRERPGPYVRPPTDRPCSALLSDDQALRPVGAAQAALPPDEAAAMTGNTIRPHLSALRPLLGR